MNFEPEITIQSKLPKFAGVSFVIHQYTEGKRIAVRTALADVNAQMRDLTLERLDAETAPELERARLYFGIMTKMRELIEDKINPVWLKTMLVSVDGLTIKGQPVTPESLISSGPREFLDEIVSAMKKEAGFTEHELGESVPPTISSDSPGVDGQTPNTNAPDAAE